LITTNGTYPWLLASMKVFYEFWYGKIAIKKKIYPGLKLYLRSTLIARPVLNQSK
jgi:hypothetical protein